MWLRKRERRDPVVNIMFKTKEGMRRRRLQQQQHKLLQTKEKILHESVRETERERERGCLCLSLSLSLCFSLSFFISLRRLLNALVDSLDSVVVVVAVRKSLLLLLRRNRISVCSGLTTARFNK